MSLTENKCSHLYEQKSLKEPLKEMMDMQMALQKRLGMDYSKMTFKERVGWIMNNWNYLTTEYVELLDRLPFKHWKKYTPEQVVGFLNEEQKMETYYEFIDMLHFFLNIALALGIDHDTLVSLYVTKNKENFARQDRGY